MSKFVKSAHRLLLSSVLDVPDLICVQQLSAQYALSLLENRARWGPYESTFGSRSVMFTYDYLASEDKAGVDAYVPKILKNDQHPKTVNLFKICEIVESWLKLDESSRDVSLDMFVRQISSQLLIVLPTHVDAMKGYLPFFRKLKCNLILTDYMLKLVGFRQSIMATCNVHTQRFGDALLFVESKHLPMKFYTTHFVTTAITPNFIVQPTDSVDVMLGCGVPVMMKSRFKESFVPGMVKSLYATGNIQDRTSCVDGITTLNVNCKEGYIFGRMMLLFSQTVNQSFLHGLTSWEIDDGVYDCDKMIFVHPDNDYIMQLTEFLLQFDSIDQLAFAIKIFCLADLVNLIAGRFYFEYSSAVSYAVWFVASGKYYDVAWSYYTRISSPTNMWPAHVLTPCMSIRRPDAQKFITRIGLTVDSKYHCLERMLIDVVETYSDNRFSQVIIALIMNIMDNKFGNAILHDVKFSHAILRIARKLAEFPLSCVQSMIKCGFSVSAIGGDRYCVSLNVLNNSNVGLTSEDMKEYARMVSELGDIPYEEQFSDSAKMQNWAKNVKFYNSKYGDDHILMYVEDDCDLCADSNTDDEENDEIYEKLDIDAEGAHHTIVPQVLGDHGEPTGKDGVNKICDSNVQHTVVEAINSIDVYNAYPPIPSEIYGDDLPLAPLGEFRIPRTMDEVLTHFLTIDDHLENLVEWSWAFHWNSLDVIEQVFLTQFYSRMKRFANKRARDQNTLLSISSMVHFIQMHHVRLTFRQLGILYAVLSSYGASNESVGGGVMFWSGASAAMLIATANRFAVQLANAHADWIRAGRPSRRYRNGRN
jgi:hypothetical protein